MTKRIFYNVIAEYIAKLVKDVKVMFEHEKFGKDFRRLRKERGIPKERLAAIVGISREAMTKFEEGHSCLKLNNLLKLLDFYQLPVTIVYKYYRRSERMQTEIERYERNLAKKNRLRSRTSKK